MLMNELLKNSSSNVTQSIELKPMLARSSGAIPIMMTFKNNNKSASSSL
jgi:hypothetical protein